MLCLLDGTLVVQLVNFVVFLFILNGIFLKPVGAAIAKRRAYINSVAEDIERFEGDLRTLRAQADEGRTTARREADVLFAEARSAAQEEGNAIVADHQVQAASMAAEAQAMVALEASTARSQESQIVESLA